MIDFKNKDELPTNVVICGSIAVLVIAGAFMKLMPAPQAPTARQNSDARKKIMNSTKAIKDKIDKERASLAVNTWPGKPEDVGPIALKQINALLQNRHLKLVGFHAQKAIEQPNITLIPFVVSVDGGFPNVMAFTRDLEQSGTKLVVNLFQLSNADQSTDKVTASIGITAYQLPPAPAVSPATAPGTAPAKPANPAKGVKKNA
jgi:hypothetical protein